MYGSSTSQCDASAPKCENEIGISLTHYVRRVTVPRLGPLGLIHTIHYVFGVQPHILRGGGMGWEGMGWDGMGRGEVAGRVALVSDASSPRDIEIL